MTSRPRSVLLLDTDGLNPYGRCLALALGETGVAIDFHRRRSSETSSHGRPFGPPRGGDGGRPARAILLGTALVRVGAAVPRSELVHTLWETRADLLIAIFAKLMRRPVVATIHDGGRPGARAERTIRWLVALADRVIVHSPRLEQELVGRVPAAQGKTEVIPLLSYFAHMRDGDRQGARSRLGLSEDRKLVLFFGQLRAGKGLRTLLAASERMFANDATVHLLVAGSDPEGGWTGEFGSLAKRFPEQVSLFLDTSTLPEQVLSDLIWATDLVALPFTRASQSSSAVFALAHGRPVVTTPVGAVEDLGESGAVALVPPGDPDQLADQCLRLLHLPVERHRLARRGLRYASTELAPSRIAAATAALYGRAIAGVTQ